MSIKENIKKIIFICLWLIIGSGLVVLLVAAMNSRENQVCKGFDIQIKGAEKNWFVDKKDIANVLTANNTIKVKNKPTKSFDLNIVESRIKKEVWIKDAELFFDNEGILK